MPVKTRPALLVEARALRPPPVDSYRWQGQPQTHCADTPTTALCGTAVTLTPIRFEPATALNPCRPCCTIYRLLRAEQDSP